MVDHKPRHRFFIDSPLHVGLRTSLSGDVAHQIQRVLRLREGNVVSLFSGNGLEYGAKLVSVGRKIIEVDITDGPFDGIVFDTPRIDLYQAMIKTDRFEHVIQKTSELGVSSITPVETERTVVSLPADRVQSRIERWQRIAVEALEQCERADYITVHDPITLGHCIGSASSVQKFVAAERSGSRPLMNALEPDTGSISLLIGPEGGFTPQELQRAIDEGWQPVTLSRSILRSETAAIAGIAMISARVFQEQP